MDNKLCGSINTDMLWTNKVIHTYVIKYYGQIEMAVYNHWTTELPLNYKLYQYSEVYLCKYVR